MKLTVNNQPNYAAKFVILREFEDIGANTIKIAITNGNRVVVAKDTPEGQRAIFFPVESQISREFLSRNGLFQDKNLNFDQTKSGFFEQKGRVRCVKLFKNPSEGFVCPVEYVTNWIGIPTSEWDKVKENTEFDTIGEHKLCNKYVIREPQQPGIAGPKRKVKKRLSRVLTSQFRFHYDTSRLLDNIHLIEPDDYIYITDKAHGASGISAKVLVKRKLSVWEKIKKFFGAKVKLTEYDYLYASRSVLKSEEENSNHYYKVNIWQEADKIVRSALEDSLTFYYEIVGFTPTGGGIQGKYTYGCKPGEMRIFVYRITSTSEDGSVKEWPMDDVVEFCNKKGIDHVSVFYKGLAKDLFPELDINNHWHEELGKKLKTSFNLEKKCQICNNGVFAEGICLRNETKGTNALKLKSRAFLLKETEELDKGIVDIESAESITVE